MLHYHRVPVLPAYTRGVIRKHKTNFGVSSHLLAQSRVAQASVMEFSSSALVRASLLLFTAALLVGAEDPEVYYDSVSRRYSMYLLCKGSNRAHKPSSSTTDALCYLCRFLSRSALSVCRFS